jgi:hypothetical protein
MPGAVKPFERLRSRLRPARIDKNCRTSVEMIEKYFAAHMKTSLDAAPINVMRPKKNKRGKKATQSTPPLPRPRGC